jgi:hypothetical protein
MESEPNQIIWKALQLAWECCMDENQEVLLDSALQNRHPSCHPRRKVRTQAKALHTNPVRIVELSGFYVAKEVILKK